MTHCLNMIAFNRERTRKMERELLKKNKNGFNLSIPKHTVSSNYAINFRKFGYRPRPSRIINPYRLGFDNPYVKHILTFHLKQSALQKHKNILIQE